jgi:hypothetical protein
MTKAELAAEVKRLQESLDRAKAKVATLEQARVKVTPLRNAIAKGPAREKATAEIVRLISSSPNDNQPVFDRIVAAARRLLGGLSATVTRVDGDTVLSQRFPSRSPSIRVSVVSANGCYRRRMAAIWKHE